MLSHPYATDEPRNAEARVTVAMCWWHGSSAVVCIRGQKFRVAKYRELPIGGHESGGILVVLLGLFAYI